MAQPSTAERENWRITLPVGSLGQIQQMTFKDAEDGPVYLAAQPNKWFIPSTRPQ